VFTVNFDNQLGAGSLAWVISGEVGGSPLSHPRRLTYNNTLPI